MSVVVNVVRLVRQPSVSLVSALTRWRRARAGPAAARRPRPHPDTVFRVLGVGPRARAAGARRMKRALNEGRARRGMVALLSTWVWALAALPIVPTTAGVDRYARPGATLDHGESPPAVLLGLGSGAQATDAAASATWRLEALEKVAAGQPFALPTTRHLVRPVPSVAGTAHAVAGGTAYRVGRETFLELGIPESRHSATLASLLSLRQVDISSPLEDGYGADQAVQLPVYVWADGVAWLVSGGALAVQEFEAALQLSSATVPAAVSQRLMLLTETAISAAVRRVENAVSSDPPTRLAVVTRGYYRSMCIDEAGVLGWMGTLLGLLMTQMPTKRRSAAQYCPFHLRAPSALCSPVCLLRATASWQSAYAARSRSVHIFGSSRSNPD